jgi:hypothetical protein
MNDSRPAGRLFGLPPWLWVVGSLLLVIVGLYGSLWLPELRERMALRYLRGLPGCEELTYAVGLCGTERSLPFVPDIEWLEWLHEYAPPPPMSYRFTIRKEFPLAELRRLSAVRQLWSFNAAGTDFSDEHVPYVLRASLLVLDGTKVTDAGLAELLRGQPYLIELSLADTAVTCAGLFASPVPSHLRTIDLSGTPIGRSGLEALARFAPPGLNALILARTSIGDEEIEAVNKLGGVSFLDLSDTRVTDAGLARLAANPRGLSINVLTLDRTKIGDDGLRALFAKLSPDNMEGLSLSGTNVTWEYIETWKSAPEVLRLAGLDIRDPAADWFVEQAGNCREADLSDTRLSDVGLAALEQCKSLRKVCVKNCVISETAAMHFLNTQVTDPVRRSSWVEPSPAPPLADRIRAYRGTVWLER